METFTITFDGIELEVYAYYHKGTNQSDDPTDLAALEISVEGVHILDLLSPDIIERIEQKVVEQYELA